MSFAYNGKAQRPSVVSVMAGSEAVPADGYTVAFSSKSPKAAGTYKVTVTGKGKYAGSVTLTYKIAAAAQPLKAKGKAVTLKASALKKKAGTISAAKAVKVTGAKTAVTYKKVKADKRNASFKVAKTGKVTVKKGTPKGTYKLKVSVTAAAKKGCYKSATATFTVTIKVK